MKRLGVILITVALIVGLVGCPSAPKYSLTIASTAGGSVMTPGEGAFTYPEGAVVNLVAEPEAGYRFVRWTGHTHTVADVDAGETTISMNDDYSITAVFEEIAKGIAIRDWYDLDGIRDDLAGHYVMMNHLDSSTNGYDELVSSSANEGKGWEPLGTFTGRFDGQGYEIGSLFINRPDDERVGLFGHVSEEGSIEGVGVTEAYVLAKRYVGVMVGWNDGTLSSSYATGELSGPEYSECLGGLVGLNTGIVSRSYATGRVRGLRSVGGLIGSNDHEGIVSDSYAACDVTGYSYAGGLVGWNSGNVVRCHSDSGVTGGDFVGGLVGGSSGSVTNCYATGSVTGDEGVGGLLGLHEGTVVNSYASGSVIGARWVGGLIGVSWLGLGIVSSSFWDIQTSDHPWSDGGTPKTTTEMQQITTFMDADWDICDVHLDARTEACIWIIANEQSYPFLSWQSVP